MLIYMLLNVENLMCSTAITCGFAGEQQPILLGILFIHFRGHKALSQHCIVADFF